jgi:phage I-like protein
MVAAMSTAVTPPVILAACFFAEGETAPDWVHLIPGPEGSPILTVDGDRRGPFRLVNAEAVIAASMGTNRLGGDLAIDSNHAIDKLGPLGIDAPARGWITALEARADGIWARVKWTPEGARMVAAREYRGISPVIVPDANGNIHRILRAGLTNDPALLGLVSLNTAETAMNPLASLAKELGLKDDADEATLLAAVRALKDGAEAKETLTALSAELGVTGGDPKALLAAVKLVKGNGADGVALQAELTSVRTKLAEITLATKRAASETYVDGKIRDLVWGFNAANREERILLHMEHPDLVENLIGKNPKLGPTHLSHTPPAADGAVTLTAEQASVARSLGIPEDAYLKTLKTEKEQR